MPHSFFMQLSGLAFVFERQLHPGAICRHFAVLDFQIGLYYFGNAQIAQCSSSRLDCISCGILPGFRTRADYLRYFIYGVCSLCLFWHVVSFLLFYCCDQFCRISSFQFSYSSGYGPLLIGPKAIAQDPFEYFAGAALWEFDL